MRYICVLNAPCCSDAVACVRTLTVIAGRLHPPYALHTLPARSSRRSAASRHSTRSPFHNVTLSSRTTSGHTLSPHAPQLTINGQLADLTHSGNSFQYYEPSLLSVRWIYPVAGPKEGNYDVTIYGTGFKTLGRPDELYGGTRGIKCLWGHLPPVEATVLFPIGSEEVSVLA